MTGGSKGFGKAMARGLAEAGADVIVCSRQKKSSSAAVDESAMARRAGQYIVADMTKRPDVSVWPDQPLISWAASTLSLTTPAATRRNRSTKSRTPIGTALSK